MTDVDKLRVKPLQDDTDYDLWVIRIKAALRALGLSDVLSTDATSETSAAGDDPGGRNIEARREKASAVIVTALGDKALTVVRNVVGDPVQMLAKLDERYNSKTIAAKISKMAELVSLQYADRKKDIGTHIDQVAGLVDQLKGMTPADRRCHGHRDSDCVDQSVQVGPCRGGYQDDPR